MITTPTERLSSPSPEYLSGPINSSREEGLEKEGASCIRDAGAISWYRDISPIPATRSRQKTSHNLAGSISRVVVNVLR